MTVIRLIPEVFEKLTEYPLPAQTLALLMNRECGDVLPALYQLQREGKAVRVSLNEDGLCGWRAAPSLDAAEGQGRR